jgi:hypothetical protein
VVIVLRGKSAARRNLGSGQTAASGGSIGQAWSFFRDKEVGMSKKDQQDGFTEIHHALLHAWMAKAIVERVGEQRGEAIIRKAIRQYGEERGRRMALRAQANKHVLSMATYIGYSEYRIRPGAIEMKIIERSPHARIRIPKCPWYATWKENELLSVGRLYCLEIDQALVRGFNPELRLDVNGTLPNGAAQCEFVYHEADLTILNYLVIQYRRAVSPGARAVMPWDYHVGHLFSRFEKVAVEELGQVGQEAIEAGLTEFAQRYGEQAMQRVVAGRGKDYGSVPEG